MTPSPASSREHDNALLYSRATDSLTLWFYRHAASGALPAGWFEKNVPPRSKLAGNTGPLTIEIVTHCWQYSNMLAYQLSSLVLHPPTQCKVIFTVYYSGEDRDTQSLLQTFSNHCVDSVEWNWCELPPQSLFRRSIGRNQAALETRADWIWFTDCDLIFHAGCLDALNQQLQGRRDALVYPSEERVTTLLPQDDPMLRKTNGGLIDIETDQFSVDKKTRATGPLQITHGDVARAAGYCNALTIFQRPAPHWCKAIEDRVFRWLIGSQGVAIDVPGVYRIRHVSKGRYQGDSLRSRLRAAIRQLQSRMRRT
jgi:hypothetical protein